MSQQLVIETRLAALEREVADIRRRLGSRDRANWLDQVAGSMQDMPEFDEVLRLGRSARQADHPSEEGPG